MHHSVNRRSFVVSAVSFPFAVKAISVAAQATPATPAIALRDQLVIDLTGEPDNLTPAFSYSPNDWSIIHSVYDSLLDFGEDGQLLPLAAESFSSNDGITFHVKLRAGQTFHDGTPVTTAAISRSVRHIQEAKSQISEMFGTITEVRELDDLTADIVCAAPSAWLPSQLAVWGVLFPESATEESLATTPVGSGPYIWDSWTAGSQIVLRRNPTYIATSPKGTPMAETVTYRFVREATTRVADLASGAADIIAAIPETDLGQIEENGNTAIQSPILGITFVRIATDTAPFDDPRIGQALNYAIDVETIAQSLIGSTTHRLASIFPDERGLGFDPMLAPFAYDPERARALLAEAGFADGLACELQVTANQQMNMIEAIVDQLAEVGVTASIVVSDLATFNQQWPDTSAPALRFASWRPMYDPQTFVHLMINPDGFLSRYTNETVGKLAMDASVAPDRAARQAIYEEMGRALQDAPAAIYCWNMQASYGVSDNAADWSPRGDEYVLPLARG